MVIKNTIKKDVIVKSAFIEMGNLVDEETGEVLNLTDVITKVYGEQPVKITITASSVEDVEIESEDSEE